MGGQAPQWLVDAVMDSLRQAGATAPAGDLEAEARAVVSLWNAPERPAHNVKYLSSLYERLADFSDVTAEPAILKLTAAYLVTSALTTWEALGGLESDRPQNPVSVSQRLTALGVPAERAARVEELVRQLSSKKVPTDDLNAQILFDAILEMLGTSPQRYAKFLELLREESGAKDGIAFLEARRKFIKAVLGRSRVFTTPFAAQWADAVRENLQGELIKIDAALGDGHQEDPGGDVDLVGIDHADRRDEALLFRSAPDAEESVPQREPEQPAPVQRRSVSEKNAAAQKTLQTHSDDTSTLEAFDDPFSHRRPKRPGSSTGR